VQWHKHDDLEKIADKIHDKYTSDIPIDIDYIIEALGLEIIDISNLKEDFGLYGLLGKVKGQFTIFIGKGDFKITNYNTNFTLAEELAHYILHKSYFKNVDDIEEAFNFYTEISEKSEMMLELNAKQLAGAILIPREDLKKRASDIYNRNKKIFHDLLKNDCDGIIDQIAVPLCDCYRVPQNAVSIRLKSKAVGFKEFLKAEYKNNC